MNAASVAYLEAFSSKFHELHKLYELLEIKGISRVAHPELSIELDKFPSYEAAIITIGLTVNCFLIHRARKSVFHVFEIDSEACVKQHTVGSLLKATQNAIKLKDYIPEPLVKKIALIDKINNEGVYGEIFYEVFPGRFSKDKPDYNKPKDFVKKEIPSCHDILLKAIRGVAIVS